MKYEDFCDMVHKYPNEYDDHIYEDLDGTKMLKVECYEVGFFFDYETHEFKYYSHCF